MSLQALIHKAPYLDAHGISERYIVEDEEWEVRVHLRVDGTTAIDVCAVDGESRDVIKRRIFPFFMYRLDHALVVARYMLVEHLIARNTTSTKEDKTAIARALYRFISDHFPYKQGRLIP